MTAFFQFASMSVGMGFPGVGLLGTMGGETQNVLKGMGRTGLDRDQGAGAGAR